MPYFFTIFVNMMKLFIPVFICLLTSCKKEYKCECFNPGGVFETHTIKDTKRKAQDKCADFDKKYNYGWSESGCSIK